MQKREFFGALLLVSLVSTIIFAGAVLSLGGPSIAVYPSTGITASSDVYIYVTGTGWTPGSPVTLYWDQQDANHTIAIMIPSPSGTFRLSNLEIETVPIGPHTIIAVQGPSTATCTYTVTATLPPDESLLSPIQQIENNLTAIDNTMANTTSGFSGIQSNLTGIQSSLSPLANSTQFASESGRFISPSSGATPYVVTWCKTLEASEFTVTVAPLSSANPAVDYYTIWGEWIVDGGVYTHAEIVSSNYNAAPVTVTIAANGVFVYANTEAGAIITYGISVEYRPGVTVLWGPY